MRYADHDELAAAALRLCEDVRSVPMYGLYAQLTKQCKTDPERMAQTILCLSAWVDVDGPARDLAARAEEVAAANQRVQERMAPDDDALREVILRHPVPTAAGTLAEGTRQLARPITADRWEIVTADGPVRVPESWIRGGALRRQTLLRARDAREEYEFARRQLGYSHVTAVLWLQEKFQVTDRQLYRWGFDHPKSAVAS